MALPSAVSVGSLALVVAAGVGLVAISASATNEESAGSPPASAATPSPASPGASSPASTSPSQRPTTPVAPAQTLHKRKAPLQQRKDAPQRRKDAPQQRKDAPHKRKDPPTAQPDAVPKVLVEVYNNSGISGLAAQEAAVLQSAGWSVAATDNWYGNIPANTVYYPPQLQDEAAQLAKVLGVQRLMPAVAPMQFDRLTVILTTA